MYGLRMLMTTIAVMTLLGAATATTAIAQEEGPPEPPPGEPFAGILTGIVQFEPLETPT